MKERNILFSQPMVKAVDAGTKTQTRRPMSVQPSDGANVRVEHYHSTITDRRGEDAPGPEVFGAWWHDGECGLVCPYGAPGDRLRVREAWRTVEEADSLAPRDLDAASRIWYEALAPHQPGYGKKRPSIFMPQWATRTTLEVTEVRVERLQDISGSDAHAEGIELRSIITFGMDADERSAAYKRAYRALWEDINGHGSWAKNPWVWVVSFRRITQ